MHSVQKKIEVHFRKPRKFNFSITISPAVVDRTDLFFEEVDLLDLQEVVNSNNGIIKIVKIATSDLYLHLGKEEVVRGWMLCEIRPSSLDSSQQCSSCHPPKPKLLNYFP